jgi:2-hydroxy-6-oxonona-2,4-dienedioate hydrolase
VSAAAVTESTSRSRAGLFKMAATHVCGGNPLSRPVVVVHGMVVASLGTMPLARSLARSGFDVHVPDLPGFGLSDKPRHALDVDGLAEVLAIWLGEMGLHGATLVGNSFGTQVVAALAARRPWITQRIVLLSPTIDSRLRGRWTRILPAGRDGGPPLGGMAGRLQLWARDVLVRPATDGQHRSLGELIAREYLAAGIPRVLSTYRHALRDDLLGHLKEVKVPVMVVRGEEDRLVSPGWAREVASSVPGTEVVEIPGADHDVQFHSPDSVTEAVSSFLSG